MSLFRKDWFSFHGAYWVGKNGMNRRYKELTDNGSDLFPAYSLADGLFLLQIKNEDGHPVVHA